MFVDSHAHLDYPGLFEDLEGVLDRARVAGVTSVLTVGCVRTGEAEISRVVEITRAHTGITAALGVHPHDARFFTAEVGESIRRQMSRSEVVAWGEIGLDFHYDNSPRDLQREAFRAQIRMAQSVGKPVVIHSREAAEETAAVLEDAYGNHVAGPNGVLHCFSGDLGTARRCMEVGFFVSFGGIVTFPKADSLREVARRIPEDRLLIETDSPYLSPAPFRGKTNEPARVVLVAEAVAELRGKSRDYVAQLTRENFDRLFRPSGRREGPNSDIFNR